MVNTRKVVVTGSSGYIGRYLCKELLERGYYVIGINRSKNNETCTESVLGDITSYGDWKYSFAGVGAVFHLAGKAHALSEVVQDNDEYFRTNTDGTRYVLQAAKEYGVTRFVYFSTTKSMSDGAVSLEDSQRCDENLIDRDLKPITEEDCSKPNTPYGLSKLEAERLVLEGGYVQQPVVLRLCMVYGGCAKGNIRKMLLAVINNRFPPIPEFRNKRSMVHVQDVVQASILAAEKPMAVGKTYIVTDGIAYSTREMLDLMRRALGKKQASVSVPLWVLNVLAYSGDVIGKIRGRRFIFDSDSLMKLKSTAWFSSTKITKELAYQPEWSLGKALPEMISELLSRRN